MLLIITLILAGATALLLVRLLMLRRELGRMTEQLKLYNRGENGKKIDVALFDGKLEGLAEQINAQSQLIIEAKALKERTQQEFRSASANMSHDIRTPLTSILGYIQLLEGDAGTPEEKREYVAIVKNRTKRLQALLNDFFELALIESPDDYLKVEKLDLTGLISDVLFSFYDTFNESGMMPVLRLTEEKLIVFGDESAIRRVMENLLLNTVKYGSGEIEIHFQRLNGEAELKIVNEAEGLDGNNVNLLFDRFYTADRARSAQTSGLGLSIARGLMSKMGGTLTAKLEGKQLMMICRWKLPD
ncbi:sensor histidine kinase [Paenibacillus sp. CAU 1782]